MGHLSDDELIDAAERAHNAPSGHLAACERCQSAVRELRDAINAAAAVDVPEPSPLFWQHFSARVHDAIAQEGAPRRRWIPWPAGLPVRPAGVAAAFGIVAAFIAGARVFGPHTAEPARRAPVAVVRQADPAAADVDIWGDPSLAVMADLITEAADEADAPAVVPPLVLGNGAVDHAVTMLTDDERIALQRLLKQELERPGA